MLCSWLVLAAIMGLLQFVHALEPRPPAQLSLFFVWFGLVWFGLGWFFFFCFPSPSHRYYCIARGRDLPFSKGAALRNQRARPIYANAEGQALRPVVDPQYDNARRRRIQQYDPNAVVSEQIGGAETGLSRNLPSPPSQWDRQRTEYDAQQARSERAPLMDPADS